MNERKLVKKLNKRSRSALWSIDLGVAIEDWENPQRRDDGSAIFTSWLVNP